MIGAFLSNTPANLLRGSGVAGETASGSGDNTPDRHQLSARESQAGPRAAAIQAGNSTVLTPQAVLALQETESPARASRHTDPAEKHTGETASSLSGQADEAQSPASRSETGQSAPEGQAKDGTGASNLAAQSQGSEKEDDADGDGLNEAEEKQVHDLAKRDREVRAHEQAHARVGGAYASAPSYTFQQGPDGKRYAIGGEVQIDTAKERTPEATIRKMQVVIRAAMAPAEPSSQDMKVAQQAQSQLAEAQAELRQQKAEELKGEDDQTSAIAEADPTEGVVAASDEKGNGADAKATTGSEEDKKEDATGREEATSAYQSAIQLGQEAQSIFNALIT